MNHQMLEQALDAAEKLWPTLEQEAPMAVRDKSLEDLRRQMLFISQMAEAQKQAAAFARRVEQRLAAAEEAMAVALRDLYSQARATINRSTQLQDLAEPLLYQSAVDEAGRRQDPVHVE